jgi:hypothetical protein
MEQIKANHDPLIDRKEVTFSFRKTKDPDTGVETKRENIDVVIEVPSVEGIVKMLQDGGKSLELLQSAVESTITDYIKSALSDDRSITSENFNPALYTWDVIANLPDTDKRGRGIPKELWEQFIESYIETMPAVIGKPVAVVRKQAAHFANKFQVLKTHELKNEVLPKFIEMLTLYTNSNPEAEQYSACIEFLIKKADEFMNMDKSTDLASNLGFE